MKRHNLLSVFLAGALTLAVGPVAFAHHSQSGEFDRNSTIEFSGTVKSVEWTNPHGYVLVNVTAEDGSVRVYEVEFSAPNGQYRAGWRKDSVAPGTPVTFSGIRSRTPESMHVAGQLMLPDGTAAYRGPGPEAR